MACPKADKLRKPATFRDREVRKATAAATRAEVRLAAIQCVVRYENGERSQFAVSNIPVR